MNKLLALFMIASTVSLSASTTQAMPLVNNQSQVNLIVPVGGGCGVFYGPSGRCSPVRGGYYKGYYKGYYNGQLEGYYEGLHDAYFGDDGPSYVVETGLCWGRGTHRVCNSHLLCWRACN